MMINHFTMGRAIIKNFDFWNFVFTNQISSKSTVFDELYINGEHLASRIRISCPK